MFEQLRELRDQHGFEVAAIVSGYQGKLIDKLRSERIPFHVINFRPGFGSPRALLQLPRTVWKLAQLLRRERFDIVQTHVFATMMIGRPAAWLADVPVRLSMIAGPLQLEAPTSRWIERATAWMETAIIASCERSLQLCHEIGIPRERLSLIYYTPDAAKFDPQHLRPANIRQRYGWTKDTPVVGMVAYFYPRLPKTRWMPEYLHKRGVKGHEDFIRAARIVLSEFPHAKFVMVGSGWTAAGDDYQREMKLLVAELGLQQSVVFGGFQEDVNGVLSELDVAVQASLSENLGGTAEALMMECPLVATRVGGMVDTVRDRETGLLVNPSDPEDLARAILELLREPQYAKALGAAGRKLMLERFTLERTTTELSTLYDCLLETNERRTDSRRQLVCFCRLLAGAPLFAYIAFRLFVIDLLLPIYVPAYLKVLAGAAIRICYLPVRVAAFVLRSAKAMAGSASRKGPLNKLDLD